MRRFRPLFSTLHDDSVLAATRLPLLSDERGVQMTEYAFLLALIAIVCAAAAGTVGTQVFSLYQHATGVF